MSFTDFRRKWHQRYRQDGPRVLPRMVKDFTVSAAGRLVEQVNYGTNVYDTEWDVLVILDGCRHDMYSELVADTPALTSVGTASTEWIRNTFDTGRYAEEMQRTAYITGNGYSATLLDPDEFGLLDEAYLYARDDERGTMPPGPLTDRAISAARSGGYDRVIVHYMQPHYPFIGDGPVTGTTLDFEDGFGQSDALREQKGIWTQIADGDRTPEPVIESYRANLEYVMPHVNLLCNNVDGRVAISADHGNALGEWGIWGHQVGTPVPGLVRVPWDVRECEDQQTYTPTRYDRISRGEVDDIDATVEQHLADLGYR